MLRFEREVDPDGSLPPDERARRAKAALSAHMRKMAYVRSRTAPTQVRNYTRSPGRSRQ